MRDMFKTKHDKIDYTMIATAAFIAISGVAIFYGSVYEALSYRDSKTQAKSIVTAMK